MDKSRQISSISESDEERMLLVRVCDKLERARERDLAANSCFLTPRQQALLRTLLPQCGFFGGTEGAERAVAYFLPEYLTAEDYFDADVIACLKLGFYEKNALSHRNILGALMGCGIKRESIGDIIVGENEAFVFVLAELKEYLRDNLSSAGRHHLSVSEVAPETVVRPPQKMKEMRVTVSSLRLDGVVSAAFHVSRGRACELIRAGDVSLNSLVCQKADRMISVADELSVRGMGKMKLLSEHGQTRKDRTAITVGVYI